jgi:hypothetical protein
MQTIKPYLTLTELKSAFEQDAKEIHVYIKALYCNFNSVNQFPWIKHHYHVVLEHREKSFLKE